MPQRSDHETWWRALTCYKNIQTQNHTDMHVIVKLHQDPPMAMGKGGGRSGKGGKGIVKFNPLTDWLVRGTWRKIQQSSSTSLFWGRPSSTVPAGEGMSTLQYCPSSNFLCQPWHRPPSKVPWSTALERPSWLSWQAQTVRVSISRQLPEAVPAAQKGSWSCSTPVTCRMLQAGDAVS